MKTKEEYKKIALEAINTYIEDDDITEEELLEFLNSKYDPLESIALALRDILEDNFTFEVWESKDYLELLYWSKKLGKTILWDSDYLTEYESIDDMAEEFATLESEIQEFENKLAHLSVASII